MSQREYFQNIQTQGHKFVLTPVAIKPQGTTTPMLGEGDPNGAYFTVVRNGVGHMTLATDDAFAGIVNAEVDTSTGYKAKLGTITKLSNNTFSIPVYTAQDASAVLGVTGSDGSGAYGGTGYSNAFAVTATGGAGTGFLAAAVGLTGAVHSVSITDPGFGYTSAPTLVFTAGGGVGATVTTALGTGAAADMPAGTFVRTMLVFRNGTVLP